MGSSACVWETLIPMPTTTASLRRSARIPASLRGPGDPSYAAASITTSFGHLRRHATSWAPHARLVARPAINGIHPRDAADQAGSGRRITENRRPLPAGVSHDRLSRPRPALWRSATTTVHSGAPADAWTSASSLVEAIVSKTVGAGSSRPREVKALMMAGAVSGDAGFAGAGTLLPYL